MKKTLSPNTWKNISILTDNRNVTPRRISGYITGELKPEDQITNHAGIFTIIEVVERRKAVGIFKGETPDHFVATCEFVPFDK